jgi:CRISPR-associated protein Cst2
MSLHIFGSIVTGFGVAANNRGETEGNITTLQKLLWKGDVHTTVSSEAIRWAIRYYWQMQGESVNRIWNDEKEEHDWQDSSWKGWNKPDGITYIDDDLMGYMKAEGGKTEGQKGKTDKRRGVLEIARAVSLIPFSGDITFNAKSGVKDRTSLYGTEVHATRYQYAFAMTPERLRVQDRALKALDAITNLGEVAGNQSRFLYDFSPESIVLRITDDPAPRILYCFEEAENGGIQVASLIKKIDSSDIDPTEIIVGGELAMNEHGATLREKGVQIFRGVKEAAKKSKERMEKWPKA